MTVAITSTAGTDYLWGNLSFSWDATEAGKAWQDASATAFIAQESDILPIAPLEARLSELNESEFLWLADGRSSAGETNISENLAVSETYIDLIAILLSVVESIAVTKTAPHDMSQSPFLETFVAADASTLMPTVVSNEQWTVIEQGNHIAFQNRSENTVFGELTARFSEIPKNSTFGLDESRITGSTSESFRTLQLAETYTDLIAFIAQIAEQLRVVDTLGNAPLGQLNEEMKFVDRILRASAAVISDLAFRSTPLDEDGFAAFVREARPLGFGAFKDLTPGDYEYANALVRLALQAPSISGSRIALTDARFIVDVPDVRDRGTIFVPVGGLIVNFNQIFNAPPEVQATFKGGGALAVPEIGQITKTGFRLTLINPTTQTSVSGNASWAAEGY